MASISNDPGGKRRILFFDPNGERKANSAGQGVQSGRLKESNTASSNCSKHSNSIGRWDPIWPNG